MVLPNSIPNLKQFLLQKKVIKLYKDFLHVTKSISNETERKEVKDWIRREFENKRDEKNIDAIKLHIHQGERALKELLKTELIWNQLNSTLNHRYFRHGRLVQASMKSVSKVMQLGENAL